MARSNNERMVTIDSGKLEEALKKAEMPASKIAEYILRRDASYLSTAKKKGIINEGDLKSLCFYLRIAPEELVTEKEPEKNTSNGDLEYISSHCFGIERELKALNEAEKNIIEELIPSVNSIFNSEMTLIAEVKALKEQNKELITTLKGMQETMKSMNILLNTTTEKVKAIFTEVKYND